MYKVMVRVWSTIRADYFEDEYSGVSYNTNEEAQKELAEAVGIFKEGGEDAWIEEV